MSTGAGRAGTVRKDAKIDPPPRGFASTALGGGVIAPVSPASIQAIFVDRAALIFKAQALSALIDDLFRGERQNPEMAEGPLAPLRLPGDNPDDALRYLLRSLGDQLKKFCAFLSGPRFDAPTACRRLRELERVARAVVQAFSVAPASGAGSAIAAMVGDLLERTGLVSWPEFLAGCGCGALPAWEATDIAFANGDAAARIVERSPAPARSQGAAPAKPARRNGGSAALPPTPAANNVPAAAADDLLDIPLVLVRPEQGDWGGALFKKGLAFLAKVYGEPADKLRPVLGAWIAQSGNDHRKVFRLLAEAQTKKVSDPKAWVSDVLSAQSPA